MKFKTLFSKDITIKNRLVISNLLMILVPVVITAAIAAASAAIIWYSITQSTGLRFGDNEDFYKASRSIALVAENSLEDISAGRQSNGLNGLTSMLDKGSLSLMVDSAGGTVYKYGQSSTFDRGLLDAVQAMGGEGFVSSGTRELYVQQSELNGVIYRIAIFASPSILSYASLKNALAITLILVLLAVFLSIFFTNRFLTRFVFEKIEGPLELLSHGVRQISQGNLDYRLEYSSNDEFTPVFADFNEMAAQLKASALQLEQHDKSRRELLVGVSHDLRSPLTSIRAYVEGLLDGVAQTPEARRRYLETIKSKAEDIERMLEKLFLFSKMEFGEYPLHPELLQLDDEVRQLAGAVGQEFAEKGLKLTLGLMTPAAVMADPELLRRVLTNIMENSLKYKSKPAGELKISLSHENGEVSLSLLDDGPGVSPEALPHLFEVFYRSDPSRQNPNHGSGIGLAIAANAVRRMNGTIEANSGEQGGLEILIRLPEGAYTHG